MNISCTYEGDREATLVAYLYDELGADDRAAFGRHLGACARCRTEVEALGGVRTQLSHWLPPEPSFRVAPTWSTPAPRLVPQPQPRTLVTRLSEIPAWAQTAAAVLLLGVSLGFANLEISYTGQEGLSVRTGWRHAPAPAATTAPAAPWQDEMAALKEEVRAALATPQSAAAAPASSPSPTSDDRVERRLVALLKESEQRQQRELALRVAEVARDMQSQRQADLVKIERSLGLIQSRTGMDYMRTQRQVNSLAQQVSQRPQ